MLHTGLRIAITFTLVCFTYVFFRAESVADAFYIATHFLAPAAATGAEPVNSFFLLSALTLIGIVLAADLWTLHYGSFQEWVASRPVWIRWPAYYATTVSLLILGVFDAPAEFIYFQF
jgi:hypothetical protein